MRFYALVFVTFFCFTNSHFVYSQENFKVIGELSEESALLKILHKMSKEETKKFSPEFAEILCKLQDRINAVAKGELLETEILHEEVSFSEAIEIFGPCLELSDYLENPIVNFVFQQSFYPTFYFIKKSQKTLVPPEEYFSESELEEIYQTSKKILKITSSGDGLISLGQSPAYIVEALEELISSDSHSENFRILYKVPFSGAPDFCHRNSHYKVYHLSNVTTRASLNYYRGVLLSKGISPNELNGKIYVIDLIGSGGSIASFLNIMVHWYKTLGRGDLPDISLLDISVVNRNFKNQTTILLPLSENCSFHIARKFVHTSAELSDKLDYTEGEDRIIPPFSALQWKKEYEDVFNQYPNEYARRVIATIKKYTKDKESINN